MNLIIIEVVLYFAGILIQAVLYARGQLTELFFVVFQVALLSLIVMQLCNLPHPNIRLAFLQEVLE